MRMFRTIAKRGALAGGTTTAAALAFPYLEDEYWYRKDPERVSSESKLSLASTVSPIADNGNTISNHKPKLVILGTGWASIAALQNLDRDLYQSITVVSPRNSFLFTPMLPSTAVGTLSQSAVTVPIRDITSYKNQSLWKRLGYIWRGYLPPCIHYAYAHADDIDPSSKTIHCNHSGRFGEKAEFKLDYDKLILSVGCKTNTWNTAGVDKYCHYLKESGDAILIRQQLIENLELASLPGTTDEQRKQLLSFYIIGGGPTGVEFAAELSDFLHDDVTNERHSFYRGVKANASNASITLVQSGDKLLPGFAPAVQSFSEEHLKTIDKVNVLTNTRVTSVTKDTLNLYDKGTKQTKKVPYGLVMWSTGVMPTKLVSSFLNKLNCAEQTSKRAIQTDSHCRVLGAPDVFAVGDCADIYLLPEYLEQTSSLFRTKRLQQQKPHGNESDSAGSTTLTKQASREFLDELKMSWSRGLLGDHDGWKVAQKIINDFEEQIEMGGLDQETVERVVRTHVSRQKHLPPTAQVAQQQGVYVANLLNKLVSSSVSPGEDDDISSATSFHYVNRGQLVYVGSHMASIAIPGTNDVEVTWNGTMTNLIWHAAYFGMLDSMTGRYELAVDWLKTIVFGRSTATSSICTDHSKAHSQALLRRNNNDDTAAPPKPKQSNLSNLLAWFGFGLKK